VKIEWGKDYPTLTTQLKRQNILCDDLIVRKVERCREAANTLFAAGIISGEELESIRLRLLKILTSACK